MFAALDPSRRILGKPLVRAAVVGVVAGLLALLAAIPAGKGRVALAAVVSCWLYFAALSAGGVALSAAARTAQGRWVDPLATALESGAAWFPVAWVLLAILLGVAPHWMPQLGSPEHPRWFSLAGRNLIGVGLLFLVGRRFSIASHADRWGERAGRLAIIYLLLYVLVISMWTVDLVMELGTGEPSAIVPAQAFIAALLSAIAWAALLSAAGAVETRLRHDLGKMLFGFSAFWAYFVWSSFLPVWYANLPAETGELIDRTSEGWDKVSFGIIGACFLLPFLLLISESVKKRPSMLGLAALSVLAALGAERFLLVMRPLHVELAPVNVVFSLGVAAGLTGLFILMVSLRMPARPRAEGME